MQTFPKCTAHPLGGGGARRAIAGGGAEWKGGRKKQNA